MKQLLCASSLVSMIAIAILICMGEGKPAMAYDSQVAQTPTPSPTATPVSKSTQNASSSTPTHQTTVVITSREMLSPTFVILSSDQSIRSPITITGQMLKWPGPPLPKDKTFANLRTAQVPKSGELVDNWERLMNDDFEGTFPKTPCYTASKNVTTQPMQLFSMLGLLNHNSQ